MKYNAAKARSRYLRRYAWGAGEWACVMYDKVYWHPITPEDEKACDWITSATNPTGREDTDAPQLADNDGADDGPAEEAEKTWQAMPSAEPAETKYGKKNRVTKRW